MDNIANQMNTLSALYALPIIRGMETLGIDAVEVVEFLARMNERGEVLPCIRTIQLLFRITKHREIEKANIMDGNLNDIAIFVDEFIADCTDILEQDMET